VIQKRKALLFLMVFAGWITIFVESTSLAQEDPHSLMQQINKMGARSAIRKLWENQGIWENVMKRIASGEEDWVELAIALYAGSDAGAASELRDAMFQALRQNPAYVLGRAEPTFPVSDLCGGRSDPLPTYKDAIAEQESTIAAVKTVKSEELNSKKEACVSKLEEEKGHLRRFFGISTN
jgi:hypothetical protein